MAALKPAFKAFVSPFTFCFSLTRLVAQLFSCANGYNIVKHQFNMLELGYPYSWFT